MQVIVARNMVMRALSLLCISGSACKLSSGLESIGKYSLGKKGFLYNIRKLVSGVHM